MAVNLMLCYRLRWRGVGDEMMPTQVLVSSIRAEQQQQHQREHRPDARLGQPGA